MDRQWLLFRLPIPMRSRSEDHVSRVVSTTVSELVSHLRAADPQGNWQFRRPDRGSDLVLSFNSTPDVLRDLEQRLRSYTAAYNWPTITDRYAPPTDKYGTAEAIRIADRLATESSDFAAALLQADESSPAEQLRLTILHLWWLSSLTAPGDRAAFLFHYWQFGTDRLAPARRVALAAEADAYTARLVDRPLDSGEERWEPYVSAIRTAVEGPQADGVPVNFLLYDHGRLTHDRLGIPVQTGALAARALRAALAAGAPVADAARSRTLEAV